MKPNEFAMAVTEMIRAEKDFFKESIENEDWDALHDEIYEYAASCVEG